jgi:cadherin 23
VGHRCLFLLLTHTHTPAKLTVNILDVNDNTPQFKPFGITYYTERVLEGATPGTTLIAVAAVDPDKGLNGLITYTLLDLTPPGYVQLEDSSAGMWQISMHTHAY